MREPGQGGCVPRTPLDCGNGNENGFKRHSGVKLPDTRSSWYDSSMNRGECETECRSNCSCTAYADLDIRNGGSGCLLWFDELVDIREYNETQVLYIRMASSELTSKHPLSCIQWLCFQQKESHDYRVVSASVCLILVGLTLAVYVRIKKKRSYMNRQDRNEDSEYDGREEDIALPSFSLSMIAKSTSNFSITNKLGQGGFGPVYKISCVCRF
ncbi:putative non-specific serine/threonine protein kinase [Helianthus annuus]|nr:putative non-specific serine/threonine protein kinase [Helianthus annuus]